MSSKTAQILYRPWGMVASVLGGLVAGQIVRQVWKRAVPGDQDDPPRALDAEYSLRQVVLAAVVQGAIFAVVHAVIERGGARLFQRWTGEWPGD